VDRQLVASPVRDLVPVSTSILEVFRAPPAEGSPLPVVPSPAGRVATRHPAEWEAKLALLDWLTRTTEGGYSTPAKGHQAESALESESWTKPLERWSLCRPISPDACLQE
jgi:hypothetical protein